VNPGWAGLNIAIMAGVHPKGETGVSSVRPRILIVDDTPSNIELLDGLRRETFEILFATKGAGRNRICSD